MRKTGLGLVLGTALFSMLAFGGMQADSVSAAQSVIKTSTGTKLLAYTDGTLGTWRNLNKGSSWKTYGTTKAGNIQLVNLGNEQYVDKNTVSVKGKKATVTGKTPVYNGSGRVIKYLPAGTRWKSNATKTINGVQFNNLGGNQWVVSADVDTQAVAPQQTANEVVSKYASDSRTVGVVNYVPGYGIALWDSSQVGRHFVPGRKLAHLSAWVVSAKETDANGNVYYKLGTNQWIEGKYLVLNHDIGAKPAGTNNGNNANHTGNTNKSSGNTGNSNTSSGKVEVISNVWYNSKQIKQFRSQASQLKAKGEGVIEILPWNDAYGDMPIGTGYIVHGKVGSHYSVTLKSNYVYSVSGNANSTHTYVPTKSATVSGTITTAGVSGLNVPYTIKRAQHWDLKKLQAAAYNQMDSYRKSKGLPALEHGIDQDRYLSNGGWMLGDPSVIDTGISYGSALLQGTPDNEAGAVKTYFSKSGWFSGYSFLPNLADSKQTGSYAVYVTYDSNQDVYNFWWASSLIA
ncbi:SLAP domain-containing protein [Lacticaseibacillus saniviri]